MIVVPEVLPIIFIDDDEIDRMVLATVLERSTLRNEAIFLHDGRAAIDYMEAVADGRQPVPGLAFLDVNMPGLTGFEVLHQVRAIADCPDFPIVMLTSSEAREDRIRAVELGANAYLPKQSGIAKFVRIFDQNFTNDSLDQRRAA